MAKIFVVPSTQESNAYATGGHEAVQMRLLRDLVVEGLKAAGHTVATVTASDRIGQREALSVGINKSNAWGSDYFISLHTNATGGKNDGSAQGAEVYIYQRGGKAEALANAVYSEVAKVTPTKDRGVKTGNLMELRLTEAPAILIESEFHDYRAYSDWLKSHLGDLAEAIVRGVCKVAGGSPKAAKPAVPTPTPTAPITGSVYIIQKGTNIIASPPKVVGSVKAGDAFTITEAQGSWGKLKSGAGWINLNDARKKQ